MGDQDKRVAARKRVLRGRDDRLQQSFVDAALHCRDISDTGAKLRVAKGLAVPHHFDLLIEVDGLEAPCTVAWKRGEDIGVTFDAPPTKGSAKRAQVVTAIDRSAPSLRRKP